MRTLLSFLVLTEVFEQNAIPAIPFLLILLVGSPFFITLAIIKRIIDPPLPEDPVSEAEAADLALLKKVRKGLAPNDDAANEAFQRVTFGCYR